MFPWLHPTVVHFAIGLLFAAVLFDVLALARSSEKLLFAGFWNTVLGGLAIVVAALTGLNAQDTLGPHSQLGDAILQFHRIFGLTAAACALGLLGWRLAMKGYIRPRLRTLYLTGAFLTLAFVLLTGAFGGNLVYRYGLGIGPATARAVLDAQPQEPAARAPSAPPLSPVPSNGPTIGPAPTDAPAATPTPVPAKAPATTPPKAAKKGSRPAGDSE